MSVLKIEFNRGEFKKEMENLVSRRFRSIDKLNEYIETQCGFNPRLIPASRTEEDSEYDYKLVSNCTIHGLDYCYLDVYFLTDNSGSLYITEIGTDFDI